MMPPAAPRPNPAKKWFLFILFGLILVTGIIIGAYYLSHNDTMGVSVIRMEGTMVTGLDSGADTIGSEVVGGELRDAADDPMIEAIVLRVNSPGGLRRPHRKLSATSITPGPKSRWLYRWGTWQPRLRIT